jgi:hypothetical protein
MSTIKFDLISFEVYMKFLFISPNTELIFNFILQASVDIKTICPPEFEFSTQHFCSHFPELILGFNRSYPLAFSAHLASFVLSYPTVEGGG